MTLVSGREKHKDFENLYRAYFSKMKYFAGVYIPPEAEAENIVQDAFMDLWERWDVSPMPVNLVAYLFTSVKNKCLNYLRHQVVRQEVSMKIQEEHRLTLKANLDSLEFFDQKVFLEEEMAKVLENALNSLSKRCREIFIMNKMEGKKQKEIATELKISVNTVETQMGIAYKKLRKELKEYLPFLFCILYW